MNSHEYFDEIYFYNTFYVNLIVTFYQLKCQLVIFSIWLIKTDFE